MLEKQSRQDHASDGGREGQSDRLKAERTQYQEGDQTGGGNMAYGNAPGNSGARMVSKDD